MTEKTPSAPPATRTCTACGQQKPLVAFLELAGDKGHSYGNICATCRGSGLGQKKAERTEPADTSGGTARAQLDNKVRIQQEQDKLAQVKHQTELDSVEKAKKDTLSLEKSTDTELAEKAEKKQREEYLNAKNQAAAPRQKTTTATEGKKLSTQSFYLDKARTEKSQFASSTQAKTAAETTRNTNQQEAKKQATGDISVVATDEQTRSVGRSDESVFGRFREYLGKSAAINRSLEQYGKKSEVVTAKRPPSFLGGTTQNKAPEKTATPEKNLSTEFMKNNLKRR